MSNTRTFYDTKVVASLEDQKSNQYKYVMNLDKHESCTTCDKGNKPSSINLVEKTKIENNLTGREHTITKLQPSDSKELHQMNQNPKIADYTPAWLCERNLKSEKFLTNDYNNNFRDYRNKSPSELGISSQKQCVIKSYLELNPNNDKYFSLNNNN
jgi:hypothetical protein